MMWTVTFPLKLEFIRKCYVLQLNSNPIITSPSF